MAFGTALVVLIHEWVTGGGLSGMPLPASWQAEGTAMRRAIARDFTALASREIKVVMTLDARLRAEPGPWDLVPIADGEHPGRLRALAGSADFTVLVAPETSGVLAGLTRDLELAGARLLGSRAPAVDLAGNKLHLAAHLRSLGIDAPFSQRVVPSEGLPQHGPYPAVLKPVDGAGSMDTFYLKGPAGLPAAVRKLPEALFQPFVPGEPMSASFLVSPDAQAWLIGMGRQRMEIADGQFRYGGGEIPVFCAARRNKSARGDRGRGPAWICRGRFRLGREAARCHDTRDQPAADDFSRGALPAVAGGPPRPGLAGGARIGGSRRTSARESLWPRACTAAGRVRCLR